MSVSSEYDSVLHPLSALEYLEEKEKLDKFNREEELVFYPELYGFRPMLDSETRSNLNQDKKMRKRIERYIKRTTLSHKRMPITKYLHEYNFVEIYLNDLQLYKNIPEAVFLCLNLRVLSLKSNFLKYISPSIGRLQKLEILELTDNCLKTNSLPYTLTFCKRLHTLYVDDNKMLALPGFLLNMSYLKTIRRLTSRYTLRDYFEMNLHESADRIKEHVTFRRPGNNEIKLKPLLYLAARCVAVSKVNYFIPGHLPISLQEYISHYYPSFVICDNCISQNRTTNGKDYYVYTIRQSYLGNCWSLFCLSACSDNCANHLKGVSLTIEAAYVDNTPNKFHTTKEVSFEKESLSKQCCSII